MWSNNKKFSSFQGKELALFVSNIPKVCQFLSDNFIITDYLRDIKTAMTLWMKLFKFLGITRIEDNKIEDYKQKIVEYKQDVEDFYKAGRNTFLSEGHNIGCKETFYMHVLRYYIPKFAEKVIEEHGLSVGIFNMQGFERRNKE